MSYLKDISNFCVGPTDQTKKTVTTEEKKKFTLRLKLDENNDVIFIKKKYYDIFLTMSSLLFYFLTRV